MITLLANVIMKGTGIIFAIQAIIKACQGSRPAAVPAGIAALSSSTGVIAVRIVISIARIRNMIAKAAK